MPLYISCKHLALIHAVSVIEFIQFLEWPAALWPPPDTKLLLAKTRGCSDTLSWCIKAQLPREGMSMALIVVPGPPSTRSSCCQGLSHHKVGCQGKRKLSPMGSLWRQAGEQQLGISQGISFILQWELRPYCSLFCPRTFCDALCVIINIL